MQNCDNWTYTVFYLGQYHKEDPKYYENPSNCQGGVPPEEGTCKVTWWGFGGCKQEEANRVSDVLETEEGIVIRVCVQKQTVAATLFDQTELLNRMSTDKYIICYHPYNLQAWKVKFHFHNDKNCPTKYIRITSEEDGSHKTVVKLIKARKQTLESTCRIFNYLDNMSKENTTLLRRLDTHAINFQAPITKLPCTLSPKFQSLCEINWPKDKSGETEYGVDDWTRIEMPYPYTYECLKREASKHEGYYWPLEELIQLAWGIITSSKNIQNINEGENTVTIIDEFECLAEFLSLHVADPKNYSYTSDLCVKQVVIKTKDDHQIFTGDGQCKFEFEWIGGEMQERGYGPHDCEDIAAKTVMIFLTLIHNILQKDPHKLFLEVTEKSKPFFDYSNSNAAMIIAIFLLKISKIANECQCYMVTGMAGAPSINKHHEKEGESDHNINQYLSDSKLGGHEYALLCSKIHKKCTILETTGWTMVNVFNSQEKPANPPEEMEAKTKAKNGYTNKRMVCNIDTNKPGQNFWRNAFCANDKLAFTTVGPSFEELGLNESSSRCVKCYSAPIEAILTRLIHDGDTYPSIEEVPICADFMETMPNKSESMKNMEDLADVYSCMNQPLISSDDFVKKKMEKWGKEKIKTSLQLQKANTIRLKKEKKNMIFSEKKIEEGVRFMSGWLGWET